MVRNFITNTDLAMHNFQGRNKKKKSYKTQECSHSFLFWWRHLAPPLADLANSIHLELGKGMEHPRVPSLFSYSEDYYFSHVGSSQ